MFVHIKNYFERNAARASGQVMFNVEAWNVPFVDAILVHVHLHISVLKRELRG
jgi:hypothetical protein